MHAMAQKTAENARPALSRHLSTALDMSVGSHFLNSVRRNDLEDVRRMLGESTTPVLDINCVDDRGRTALVIAIENGQLDIVQLLLDNKIIVGDALMHAIQIESADAVEIICKHFAQNLPDEVDGSHTIGDVFSKGDSYMNTMTPLMYAARLNQYDVIKVLIDYGATMPSQEEVLKHVEGEDQERAIATHLWYQAMCSGSYILLSSDDPLQTAFDMALEIKILRNKLPVMRDDYDILRGQLEAFVAKFLDFVQDGEEVKALLSGGEEVGEEIFPRLLRRAARVDFKLFAAHGNTQEYLLGRWYEGYLNWRIMSMTRFYLMSLLTLYLYPLPCLAYILSPWRNLKFLNTPYVRFLLHTSSRLCFLLILAYTVTKNDDSFRVDGIKAGGFLLFAGTRPDTPSVLIYVWVVGMTWREIRQCYHIGPKAYWRRRFNRGALLQLILYWVAFPFYLMPKVEDVHSTSLPTQEAGWSTAPSPFQIEAKPSEYQLIAVGIFSIANVFTFMTVFHGLVIVNFMGPLQISLGKMIEDIVKFFCLFILVWFSFAIGLTQLYQVIEIVDGQKHGFETLPESMATLFWSLFSMYDYQNLKLNSQQPLVEIIGTTLYAVFMLLCPLILMTALVAMMSNTYTRVEENAETEWKVARARLMGEYLADYTTLPPPLNVIPTAKQIIQLVQYFRKCVHCRKGTRGLHPTSTEMNFLPKRPRSISSASTLCRYREIVEKLVHRYILELRTSLTKERHNDWVKTEILQLQKAQHNIGTQVQETCKSTIEVLNKLQEDMAKLTKDIELLKTTSTQGQLKVKEESRC